MFIDLGHQDVVADRSIIKAVIQEAMVSIECYSVQCQYTKPIINTLFFQVTSTPISTPQRHEVTTSTPSRPEQQAASLSRSSCSGVQLPLGTSGSTLHLAKPIAVNRL